MGGRLRFLFSPEQVLKIYRFIRREKEKIDTDVCREVKYKYIFNDFLLGLDLIFRHKHALHKPTSLQIETSGICNLRCKICPIRYHRRSGGLMSFKNFKKILSQFKYLRSLCLHGLGEPFLNPDIYKMINYAKRRGIRKIWLVTNGTKMNVDKVVDSSLDEVWFSVDTVKDYQKIRGIDVNVVIEKISKLLKKRKKRPKMIITMVLTKETFKDIIHTINVFDDLGVDGFMAFDFNRIFAGKGSYHQITDKQSKTICDHVIQMQTNFIYTPQPSICLFPWLTPYITWNGFVTPCCIKWDETLNIGNVLKEDFSKIWNNSFYRHSRGCNKCLHQY